MWNSKHLDLHDIAKAWAAGLFPTTVNYRYDQNVVMLALPNRLPYDSSVVRELLNWFVEYSKEVHPLQYSEVTFNHSDIWLPVGPLFTSPTVSDQVVGIVKYAQNGCRVLLNSVGEVRAPKQN